MGQRSVYALVGALVLVGVDLVVNLLAAAIQQQAFGNQFSGSSVWWLAGLALAGLLVGYWLGGKISVPAPQTDPPAAEASPKTVSVTRLKALFSYTTLRGRGVRLSDILLVGSRLEIDSRD